MMSAVTFREPPPRIDEARLLASVAKQLESFHESIARQMSQSKAARDVVLESVERRVLALETSQDRLGQQVASLKGGYAGMSSELQEQARRAGVREERMMEACRRMEERCDARPLDNVRFRASTVNLELHNTASFPGAVSGAAGETAPVSPTASLGGASPNSGAPDVAGLREAAEAEAQRAILALDITGQFDRLRSEVVDLVERMQRESLTAAETLVHELMSAGRHELRSEVEALARELAEGERREALARIETLAREALEARMTSPKPDLHIEGAFDVAPPCEAFATAEVASSPVGADASPPPVAEVPAARVDVDGAAWGTADILGDNLGSTPSEGHVQQQPSGTVRVLGGIVVSAGLAAAAVAVQCLVRRAGG